MTRYVFTARVLHWLMAVVFAFMLISGYAMINVVQEDSALEGQLFGLHISTGVTLAFLMMARVFIRLTNTPPALPSTFTPLEKQGAHLVHLALYLLPLSIISIGWAEVDFGGHGVKWFGLTVPKIFPTTHSLAGVDPSEVAETLHRWLAYGFLSLIALHILAAVKHRWLDGHDVLYRMTFNMRGK